MEFFFPPFAGAATQARNPQRSYAPLYTAGGLQLTASNGANAIGPYLSVGTPTVDLVGLEISIYSPSSTAARYQLLLRINGTTVIVPSISVRANGATKFRLPIKVAANSLIEAAIRSGSNGTSLRIGVQGIVANALDATGYDNMVQLDTVGNGSTRGGNVSLTDNSTWTTLIASTTQAYGALAFNLEPNANPLVGQRVIVALATGISGSEVEFWRGQFHISVSAPYIYGANSLIETPIPSGSRISCQIIPEGTASADTFYPALWGFY